MSLFEAATRVPFIVRAPWLTMSVGQTTWAFVEMVECANNQFTTAVYTYTLSQPKRDLLPEEALLISICSPQRVPNISCTRRPAGSSVGRRGGQRDLFAASVPRSNWNRLEQGRCVFTVRKVWKPMSEHMLPAARLPT